MTRGRAAWNCNDTKVDRPARLHSDRPQERLRAAARAEASHLHACEG